MEQQHKNSSTFGIIALIISALLLFTPRFLISMGLMAWAIFMIIGFVRDGSKVFSIISLLIGGAVMYFMVMEGVHSVEEYKVEYIVNCFDCSVNYTNETGGDSKVSQVNGQWRHTITAKGDAFLNLSAQNNKDYGTATVYINVNDKTLKTEESSGGYAIANVYARPEEIHTVQP